MVNKVTVYCAHSMTGRTGEDLIKESSHAATLLSFYGIRTLDPVIAEKIMASKDKIKSSEARLQHFWKRDKELIRASDVVLDLTGSHKSAGVEHEVGYARYFLWIPVVRVWPKLGVSVAKLEDDLIVDNLETAAVEIRERWGTYSKRLMWRLRMLNKSLLRHLWFQFRRLFQ